MKKYDEKELAKHRAASVLIEIFNNHKDLIEKLVKQKEEAQNTNK